MNIVTKESICHTCNHPLWQHTYSDLNSKGEVVFAPCSAKIKEKNCNCRYFKPTNNK